MQTKWTESERIWRVYSAGTVALYTLVDRSTQKQALDVNTESTYTHTLHDEMLWNDFAAFCPLPVCFDIQLVANHLWERNENQPLKWTEEGIKNRIVRKMETIYGTETNQGQAIEMTVTIHTYWYFVSLVCTQIRISFEVNCIIFQWQQQK